MADTRVRIKVQWENKEWFFVRMEDPTRPLITPADDIRRSALLSCEVAVAVCKKLREQGWEASIVTTGGVTLYEEAVSTPPQNARVEDRVPHYVGNILIVPGNPSGWYIRFPGQPIESIRGESPDDCYQKLISHVRAAEMIPLAEKFIPPPEPPIDTEALKRELQFARHGRIRPAGLG